MIDTIRLYQPAFVSRRFGEIDYHKFNIHKSTKNDIIYFNTFYDIEGKAPINVKYDMGRDYITITFSVPKLIYGNSINDFSFTDYEISTLLKNLNERLEGIVYDADFLQMRVSRLDIAKNISTDYHVRAYLKLLRYCLDVSKKYKIQEFNDTSLIVSNKSKRIIFYDKEDEQLRSKELSSDYKRTGKVLRFECQLKNMSMIKKELKLENSYLTFFDVLNNPNLFSGYLFELLKAITKDYILNSDLNEFQSDLMLISEISKHHKRNLFLYYLLKKYVKDFDIKNYEALLSYAGLSDKATYHIKRKFEKLEAIKFDKKEFDLIKELAKKLEFSICNFDYQYLHSSS